MRIPALLTAAMILLSAAALAADTVTPPPAASPVEAPPQAPPSNRSRMPRPRTLQAPLPAAVPSEAQPQAPSPAATPAEAQPQAPPQAAVPSEAQPQAPPPAAAPAEAQPLAPPQATVPAEAQPQAPPQAAPPAASGQQRAPAGVKEGPGRSPVYLSMDFTDVDLPVLIKFMSEQTRKNFIFDERVQGKITIISPRKLTEDEAYNVFLSVLQVKGFTTVPLGNTIKIVPAREARQDTIPTAEGEKAKYPGSEFITRLVPLQHVESPEVVTLLTPIISKDGLITSFTSSNTILLIDSRANIDRIMGIIGQIDVETPGEMKVFRLTYAAAQDLGKTLEAVFQQSATPAAAQVRGRTRRFTPPRGATLKFIPEVRTNNLIVLAPPDTMEDIADLVSKLDVPIPSGGGKINVYYLENADAEEVSKVLSSLSVSSQGQPAQPARAPGQPPGAQPTIRGVIAAELEGGVKVTADKATNALVIVASPNDFETLIAVIKKLDIRRRQVFVEAVIMEIDVTKALDLGLEWRGAVQVGGGDSGAIIGGSNFGLTGGLNDLLTGLASGNALIFPGTGLVAGGVGGSVTLPDGTKVPAIAAVLRASAANNNLNILSAPNLLTQNNKEAEIIVAENVPFISSQSRDSTNLANVINTVERKDVGITLRLTPHIHESEFVSMDIYQEASALKTDAVTLAQTATVGPTWTKRSAKTTVLVKSGDTVILGGIMQESNTENISKVPILGDIPLLGWLFKTKSKQKQKTNLVILLTPFIIQEPGRLASGLEERQRKMLQPFSQNEDEVRRALPRPQPAPTQPVPPAGGAKFMPSQPVPEAETPLPAPQPPVPQAGAPEPMTLQPAPLPAQQGGPLQ
jgi:general secretion pathway protein D